MIFAQAVIGGMIGRVLTGAVLVGIVHRRSAHPRRGRLGDPRQLRARLASHACKDFSGGDGGVGIAARRRHRHDADRGSPRRRHAAGRVHAICPRAGGGAGGEPVRQSFRAGRVRLRRQSDERRGGLELLAAPVSPACCWSPPPKRVGGCGCRRARCWGLCSAPRWRKISAFRRNFRRRCSPSPMSRSAGASACALPENFCCMFFARCRRRSAPFWRCSPAAARSALCWRGSRGSTR